MIDNQGWWHSGVVDEYKWICEVLLDGLAAAGDVQSDDTGSSSQLLLPLLNALVWQCTVPGSACVSSIQMWILWHP